MSPGVATWQEFKAQAIKIAEAPLGPGAPRFGTTTSNEHSFDISDGGAYALRKLGPRGYRQAAAATFAALAKKFGTTDPSHWRDKRLMYDVSAQGAGSAPPLPFFDRGTWEQIVEVGP